MYFIFIFWHILAVIGIRVRWIAPSSGASSHHLCVWKLRSSSCCSSHSLLLNTEIHVMVLIPSLLLLLAFALTSSLCALYIGLRLVIQRHRSLLMLPDGLMTRTALYSSLSTCDDTIILYKYLQQPYEEMEIFQVVHIFTKEQWNIILHAQIIIYCFYYL